MSNYIINDDHYYTIFSYHQNENSIKRYFEDQFNIEKKMLQKVNIFNKDGLPELKAPPRGMFEAVFGGRTESQDNTEFDIDNAINLYSSPVPPRIHSFVSVCETDEINIFANSMRFLDVVLRSPVPQADDVVAGFIRFASDTFLGNENIKLEAARFLANMLSNDTRRLDGIIRRIR